MAAINAGFSHSAKYFRKARTHAYLLKNSKTEFLYTVSVQCTLYRVITLYCRGKTLSSSLKLEPFVVLFWFSALYLNISVDLSLFYNTNFVKKHKFNDFYKKKLKIMH